MTTIQFNEVSYEIPQSGAWVSGETFMTTIIKGDYTVEEISEAVVGCDDIVVTETDDETGEVISITHYEGYTEFSRSVYMKDYIIGFDPETEQDILADIVEVSLRGKNEIEILEGQVDKNTADIDYIAMMTDVEIPVE